MREHVRCQGEYTTWCNFHHFEPDVVLRPSHTTVIRFQAVPPFVRPFFFFFLREALLPLGGWLSAKTRTGALFMKPPSTAGCPRHHRNA